MFIGPQGIGRKFPPFIIAEISANHDGCIEKAKLAIRSAKLAGASAVKLQTYTPDTMTLDMNTPDFTIDSGLWAGRSLYELYSEAYTPFEWHDELFQYAASIGLTIFSSPFDESAVDLLQGLSAPAYKIASFELVDLSLIECVAATGKPLLISTGMASYVEVAEALETARSKGAADILLFHCISSYPAELDTSNLNMIGRLKSDFQVEVGLSDHTKSSLAATTAIALGAVAIEKHFKPNDMVAGPDSSFSINPTEFAELVKVCKQVWSALGSDDYTRSLKEIDSLRFRRSLYFGSDLASGSTITADDVRVIRPGYGLPPKYLKRVLGLCVSRDVKRGDRVSAESLVGFDE